MADTKLSALTEATTLTEAAVLYAVVGGASRKVTAETLLSLSPAADAAPLAAEALAADDVLYVLADGTVGKAKADALATLPGVFVAVEAADAAAPVRARCVGRVTLAADPAWTPGQPVYVSAATAGALTQTAPDTPGQYVQAVGLALASDELLLAPQLVPSYVT